MLSYQQVHMKYDYPSVDILKHICNNVDVDHRPGFHYINDHSHHCQWSNWYI